MQCFEGKYDEILVKVVWSSIGDGVSRRTQSCRVVSLCRRGSKPVRECESAVKLCGYTLDVLRGWRRAIFEKRCRHLDGG